MRLSNTFLLVIVGLVAVQHCQGQEISNGPPDTTILGRLFGGIFAGGLISLWDDNPSNSTGQASSERPEGNIQLMTCTQSSVCYSDSTQTPGAWTCRPQVVGRVSVCVPTLLGITPGRDGDTCGCCDGNCPTKCECGCTNSRGVEGVMTRFNLLFGLVRFEQCLEPTVADAATSFTTLDIECSDVCAGTTDGGGR